MPTIEKPTGWYSSPGREPRDMSDARVIAHQFVGKDGAIWTAITETIETRYPYLGVEMPPGQPESEPETGGQYAARLERTIETLHAERAMLLAESEMHRLRAAWREKQRDHLQIELRARDLEARRAAKLADDRQDQLEELEPLLAAMVTYHAAEFMGWKLEGLDPKEVRNEFDQQVENYRNRVGLSGCVATEVPF